jgi:hypothetical protein
VGAADSSKAQHMGQARSNSRKKSKMSLSVTETARFATHQGPQKLGEMAGKQYGHGGQRHFTGIKRNRG